MFEAHLNVSNLDRSIAFYRDVLGLELAHRIPERHCAFFWMGAPGQTMLGLWCIYTTPIRERLHIAFRVDLEDVIASVERLRVAGITPRSTGGGPEIAEPRVAPWRPGQACFLTILTVTHWNLRASCQTHLVQTLIACPFQRGAALWLKLNDRRGTVG